MTLIEQLRQESRKATTVQPAKEPVLAYDYTRVIHP